MKFYLPMNLLAKTAPAGIWTRVPAPRATVRTTPEWAAMAALRAAVTAIAVGLQWRPSVIVVVAAERASRRTWLRHRPSFQYCSHFGRDDAYTDGWFYWARCSMTTSTRQQHPASQAGPLNSSAIAPLLSRRRTRWSTAASTHFRHHNIGYWAPNSATGCCC